MSVHGAASALMRHINKIVYRDGTGLRLGEAVPQYETLRDALIASSSREAEIYEECARTAECWRCETHDDSPLHIRERTTRQNKVATEIAAAIRAKAGR